MSVATDAYLDTTHASSKRFIPGEIGIWVFIFADLFTFAIYFTGYFNSRALHTADFAAASGSLTMTVALINTLVLLTSSLLVVIAANAMRAGAAAMPVAKVALKLAMLCGLTFVALKLYEYTHMIGLGETANASVYFGYFYVLTGMHFCHVIGGLIILYMLHRKATLGRALEPREIRLAEAGACYWHLVDLLWMIIFPLLYMVA